LIIIFLRDTVYLIENMEIDEIFDIANTEGLNSPKLRAKARRQFNGLVYNSSMVKSFLPDIKIGVFEAGDGYDVKSISDISDLDYFIGPDGKKYTCELDYNVSASLMSDITEVYDPIVESQPVLEDIYDPIISSTHVESKENEFRELPNVIELGPVPVSSSDEEVQAEDRSLGEETEENSESKELIPFVISLPPARKILSTNSGDDSEISTPKLVEDETSVAPVIEFTEEQLEKIKEADFFDKFLSKFPNIGHWLKTTGDNRGCNKYLRECVERDDFDRRFRDPFLKDAGILDVIDGDLGNREMIFEYGESDNMFDAVLVFPVFSAIIGKKNLKEKFSFKGLVDAYFIRICPVGVSEDMNMAVFGFVDSIKLTSEIVSNIEEMIKEDLKEEGKKFSSLSSEEKYKRFEEMFVFVYLNLYGNLLHCFEEKEKEYRKFSMFDSLTVDIGKFLKSLQIKNYFVPDVVDEVGNKMLWSTYETVVFDNRLVNPSNENYKTLKTQLETLYKKENEANNHSDIEDYVEIVDKTVEEKMSEGPAETGVSSLLVEPSVQPSQEEIQDALQSADVDFINRLIGHAELSDSDGFTLHNSTGEKIGEIPTRPVAPPASSAFSRDLTSRDLVSGSITMGGVDPKKPTKFVDEEGREWISEEARALVLEEIFGSSIDDSEQKKKL